VHNPARTSEFLLRRDQRQGELKAILNDILAGHTEITLEIGCGHGHYLTAYAQAHPESFCLGIDLLKDRIARASRKRDRAGLKNLVFLQAEARECLAALPADVRLAKIFILFPDPWPKRRHHKNRILQPEFLTALAEKSASDAHLFFRTDYAPYHADAAETIEGHSDWKRDLTTPWPFELVTVFQSRAESYQSIVATRKLSLEKSG
jgi:tRNA (guanine-N(7)-)-methyltransferase